jgi:cell division protein FtsQ
VKKRSSLRWHWLLGLGLSLGLAALVVVAFQWAEYTHYLAVKQVIITGNRIIPDEEYRKIIGDLQGQPITSVHPGEVGSRLEEHPYVQAARVSRLFPATVKVELVERIPLAMVNIQPLVLIDAEGVVLPDVGNALDLPLPSLSNFNTARELYPAGQPVLSRKVMEATSLLARVRREYPRLYRNLSEIRLNPQDEYELILSEEPTRVVLGKANLWDKLVVLREFEKTVGHRRHLTDYTYLDLRYKNQVIARERRT